MAKKTVVQLEDLEPPKFTKEEQDSNEGQQRRYITKIIIHCSDSLWGNFKHIDEWHKLRWNGIVHFGKRIYCGYHYIVLNGHPEYSKDYANSYIPDMDGAVEKGRPDAYIGSHCKGQNAHSLGICLIGVHDFTKKQFVGLSSLIDTLLVKYPDIRYIDPHNKYSTKTCPNFDVQAFVSKWGSGYFSK